MKIWLFVIIACFSFQLRVQSENLDTLLFKVMSYNVENLFDTAHDSLKNDSEFLPEGIRHWNYSKYRRKLDNIARVISAVGERNPPALVSLCEVENKKVLNDLTKYSALKEYDYQFILTDSPDERGIDVALLYQREFFKYLGHNEIPASGIGKNYRPTRNILHVFGKILNGDTLDVFVVHAPSRSSGIKSTQKYRLRTAYLLKAQIDSLGYSRQSPNILIMGDFNDNPNNTVFTKILLPPSSESDNQHTTVENLTAHLWTNKTGTYKYKGQWDMLDHILVNKSLLDNKGTFFTDKQRASIYMNRFLLETDMEYGGTKPYRTYYGMKYQPGYSDHLPVYTTFTLLY